ncbi:hypothetical protein P280DRAFT_514674 [Massarina eburnea CBS 473.64]|uniref:Uncharacterized protein n=1 Tax=Massarina eburnea CBS 473.64 TaxID=1395130 RepID=A0A6A6S7E3_9PLEO|nr:hypothetical protein P280DRAFT_514674 [Massarina eburnea CBS 473.64]
MPSTNVPSVNESAAEAETTQANTQTSTSNTEAPTRPDPSNLGIRGRQGQAVAAPRRRIRLRLRLGPPSPPQPRASRNGDGRDMITQREIEEWREYGEAVAVWSRARTRDIDTLVRARRIRRSPGGERDLQVEAEERNNLLRRIAEINDIQATLDRGLRIMRLVIAGKSAEAGDWEEEDLAGSHCCGLYQKPARKFR